MSSQKSRAQVPRIRVESATSRSSSRVPIPGRHSSLSHRLDGKEEVASNAVPETQVERQSTVIVRKKLPWLDGKTTYVPGQFESKESLELRDLQDPGRSQQPAPLMSLEAISTSGKRPSASSLGRDPALREVGSTPSLREHPNFGEFKRLSLSSQPRPGVKPIMSKRDAKKQLGMVDERPLETVSTSSKYSSSPSTEQEDIPHSFPMQHASSYERLVDRRASMQPELRQTPLQVADQWLPADFHLPPNDGISPGNTIKSASDQHSPRRHHKSSDIRRKSDGYGSYNHAVQPKPFEMPKAKTLPRRSTMAQYLEPIQPPPPPPRKDTLYAMPTHLLPSSSSSSHEPMPRAQWRPVQRPVQQPVQQPPPAPLPPTRPAPVLTSQDMRRKSQSLNRAVSGLENLMEEALHVARNAAENGRDDDVAKILDNATLALRKASTVNGQLNTGRMSQPLIVSPAVSNHSSDSDSDGPFSDASSMRSRDPSIDTAPTMFTRSAQSSQQPILVDQYKPGGQTPVSMKASVETVRERTQQMSPDRQSISHTPPRLYQPPSADSIVRDFAYARAKTAKAEAARQLSRSYGEAADYYGDTGQSVGAQPGVRQSFSAPTMTNDKPLPSLPTGYSRQSIGSFNLIDPPRGRRQSAPVRRLEPEPTNTIPPRVSSRSYEQLPEFDPAPRRRNHTRPHRSHLSDFIEAPYYHERAKGQEPGNANPSELKRGDSLVTDKRYDPKNDKRGSVSKSTTRYSGPTTMLQRNFTLKHPRRNHISLREGQGFSLGRYHRRQPIAREWRTSRKRITAMIACLNTMFVGLIAGIYAGEVPRIQYQLADQTHKVILGNVVLFACLGLSTLIFWPLPLLHGRKPYTLMAFALMLPLVFPQALVVSGYRNPNNPIFRCGLLISRAFQGFAMGFANINFLPTLFDLFGASLMSEKPHQEIVVYDDIRRQGGGIGIWLGIWSFCFVGSMSVGFCIGAVIISALDPSWGFYIIVILLAFFLLVNVIAPETRRAPYRRSIAQYVDDDEKLKRRVARGEVKLHISNEGPRWWFEEVWAGIILTTRMVFQPGCFLLMLYLAWMYAQVTLVILFLGALLSRDYMWESQYVGPAVLSVAIGAFLAVPLSKANLFSRARDHPQRTDSMTMKHSRVTWSSHMLRRCFFTMTLPFAALAYTLSAPGPSVSWVSPTIFCGLVGFLSNLAIAECVGLIMETYDTCDLQPGVNQKHRLQSMAETTRRRRTNYSSFPRICAGFFAAQSLGFFLSAAATGVSGDITRAVGAQTATAIVAAVLLTLTVLFIIVLWRWKQVQVIPNNAFGTKTGSIAWGPGADDPEWKPVIIGNPSGKFRRMNMLELGNLSRWTEIRKLNKLVRN